MKNIIGPVVLVVLAIAIFFAVTEPLLAGVAEYKTTQMELNAALDNAELLQDTRDTIDVEFNNFPLPDRAKLDTFLPDSIDNVKLIIDIDDIAKKRAMSIKNTSLDTDSRRDTKLGPDTGSYGTMRLSFTVSGSYAQLERFLEDLARSRRLIDVVSINFRAAEKDFYEYNIVVQTYWLR